MSNRGQVLYEKHGGNRGCIGRLYNAWLEDNCEPVGKAEQRVRRLSRMLDEVDGRPGGELLGDYEEAARRSGFEAGFRAALSLFTEVRL